MEPGTHYSGSSESEPLDYQGSPILSVTSHVTISVLGCPTICHPPVGPKGLRQVLITTKFQGFREALTLREQEPLDKCVMNEMRRKGQVRTLYRLESRSSSE